MSRPCHKLAFSTVEQAERTAAIIERMALRAGEPKPKRLYECPECGLYHFTSMTENEYRGGPVEPGAARCSREGCTDPGTYHCEGCGRPVCFQHVKMSGPLSSMRHLCGVCQAEPDLPTSPPPLPEAPVAAGPFAKVELPKKVPARQAWVREAHRPTAPVVAMRVVEAEPRPAKPPKRPAKIAPAVKPSAPPPQQVYSDVAWFKLMAHDAALLIREEGRVLDAYLMLDALASLPRKFSPSADAKEAERVVRERMEDRRAWFLADLTRAKCVPVQTVGPMPGSSVDAVSRDPAPSQPVAETVVGRDAPSPGLLKADASSAGGAARDPGGKT